MKLQRQVLQRIRDIRMASERTAPPPETKAAITHAIFDMDGVLLDTEEFYTQARERILARFGKTFDHRLKAKLVGKKPAESARIFVEETGLVGILNPAAFHAEREKMLRQLDHECDLLPGVERTINHLHSNGIPMCVATGSDKERFELLTQKHSEIFSMMHHVITGDDPEVKKAKPSPDFFLAAAEKFAAKVDPSKVLVFEDTPSGVFAAKTAGMWVVKLPCPWLDDVSDDDADQVLSTLLDLNPSKWGLPPFRGDASVN